MFGFSRLSIQTVSDFRTRITIPCIDKLHENITHRFSDDALKVVTAMSIFNLVLIPNVEDPHTAMKRLTFQPISMEMKQVLSKMEHISLHHHS